MALINEPRREEVLVLLPSMETACPPLPGGEEKAAGEAGGET